MVTLWNPADEPQDFVLTLFFTGGQYALPLRLGPRATRTFNISEIVNNQVPDADGNIIPASIREGGGVISGPQGVPQHILVAIDAGIYNVKKATCQPTCESCYGATSSAVVASTFAVPVQNTVQQNFIITWGNGTQTNANSSPWTTTAPSVATVASSLVSGVSAGSATVAASAYEQVEVAQFCFMNGNPPCPSGNMQGSSPRTVPALSCPGPVTRGNSMTCTVTCGGWPGYRRQSHNSLRAPGSRPGLLFGR